MIEYVKVYVKKKVSWLSKSCHDQQFLYNHVKLHPIHVILLLQFDLTE